MKTIKDRNKITAEYCSRLEKWLIENQDTFFSNKDNDADSWRDFETWPDKKTDRNHLIINGEVCLIDRDWEGRHAYVICQWYANATKIKDLYRVVFIDDLKRSAWRNGFFLIPDIEG